MRCFIDIKPDVLVVTKVFQQACYCRCSLRPGKIAPQFSVDMFVREQDLNGISDCNASVLSVEDDASNVVRRIFLAAGILDGVLDRLQQDQQSPWRVTKSFFQRITPFFNVVWVISQADPTDVGELIGVSIINGSQQA